MLFCILFLKGICVSFWISFYILKRRKRGAMHWEEGKLGWGKWQISGTSHPTNCSIYHHTTYPKIDLQNNWQLNIKWQILLKIDLLITEWLTNLNYFSGNSKPSFSDLKQCLLRQDQRHSHGKVFRHNLNFHGGHFQYVSNTLAIRDSGDPVLVS